LRLSTVIISVALHVALGATLLAVKNRDVRRRAISVAVTEAKKKENPPKPPAPPKPIVRPPSHKEAHVEPKAAAPVHAAKFVAPVATNLAMSNADLDVGPGIGLEGRAAAKPTAAAAAAPTRAKVASAISERRTQQTREEAAGDQPCTEEPSKPEAVVQSPAIDYTVYPQAQADGIEGKFKAMLVIAANGSVESVAVLAGLDPAFDAAIVAALKRWRFKPAIACGKPVDGAKLPFTARFELGD
jgi:TonB family protein